MNYNGRYLQWSTSAAGVGSATHVSFAVSSRVLVNFLANLKLQLHKSVMDSIPLSLFLYSHVNNLINRIKLYCFEIIYCSILTSMLIIFLWPVLVSVMFVYNNKI